MSVSMAMERKEKRLPTSVYLGVCLDKKAGKYRAQYAFEKRILFLGYSMCQEELAMKYDLLVQLLVGSAIPTNCSSEFYNELLQDLRSRSRGFTAHECCVMIRKMDLSSRVPQFLDKVSPDTMALKKMRGANFVRGEGLGSSGLGNQAVIQCINGSVINVQGHPRDLRSDLDYLNSHQKVEAASEESGGGAAGDAKKGDKSNNDINLHTSDDEQTVSESPELEPIKKRRLQENPLLRATEVWISAESPRKDTATSAPPKDSSVEIVETPSHAQIKEEKKGVAAAAQPSTTQPQTQQQHPSPFPRAMKQRLSIEETEKNMIHRICSVTQNNMAVIGAASPPLTPAQHTQHIAQQSQHQTAQHQATAQVIPTIKYEARPGPPTATPVELNPLKIISSVIAVDDSHIYNRINNLQGTQRVAMSDDDFAVIDFATTALERQGVLSSKEVVQIYSLLEANPQLRQQSVQYLRIRMRGPMSESKHQLIEKHLKDLLLASKTWWSA